MDVILGNASSANNILSKFESYNDIALFSNINKCCYFTSKQLIDQKRNEYLKQILSDYHTHITEYKELFSRVMTWSDYIDNIIICNDKLDTIQSFLKRHETILNYQDPDTTLTPPSLDTTWIDYVYQCIEELRYELQDYECLMMVSSPMN